MNLQTSRNMFINFCAQRRSYNSMKHLFLASSILTGMCFLVVCLRGPKLREQQNADSGISQATEPQQIPKREKFPLVEEFELRSKKKFDNEEARLIGFPLPRNRRNQSRKMIYLATRFFGEWNPKHYYSLHLGSKTFARYPCAVNSCYVTNRPSDVRESHAVLFHLRDLEVFSPPSFRLPQQIWILYSMEPPWLEVRDMKRFNGVFNWTMSYRRGSDVLMSYGFVGKRPRPAKSDRTALSDLFSRKSDKAVWYVSDCRTDSNREEYVMRLRRVYPVDVIGGCGTDGCRPAETKRCYARLEQTYKFYLSFENAVCRDYVTEKLYNALEQFLVPVTFGGANYSDLTPRQSIINAMEFSSPEELGRFLWRVSRNISLYLSYFEWKQDYRSYLQPWMCDLCEMLQHPPVAPKTIHNLDTWWNEGGSCRRWSAEGLAPIKSHVFPRYNHKLF